MDVTFHMLALDVLSGRPEPAGSAPSLVDSYEVWGYRHHPAAVAIIRSFDAGAAVACGAFMPDDVAADERFAHAVDRLVELRIPAAAVVAGAGRLSDLELLDAVPAFQRIAHALALDLARKGVETHPAMNGSPSDYTLDYLETLRFLDPSRVADEGNSPLFEAMADALLEDPDGLRWTGARERLGEERIEVMVHASYPAATLLAHFRASGEPPAIAAYLPPLDDDAIHDRIIDDIRGLVVARALGTATPLPLPVGGAFRRLGHDRALAQLESILEDIGGGDGCMHDFPFGPETEGPAEDPESDPTDGTRRMMH
jgi:hypothetical protein